ncbi:MAG TPA: hypothetical protein VE035_16195 [Puia sp.]|nr:hypothetical protein [Puia sp.]
MKPFPETGTIYTLNDPITGMVRYVGQTIVPLKERLKKHIADSAKANVHVRCWIKGLVNQGLRPVIKVLEICNIDLLDEREVFHIQDFRSKRIDLTNISLGGQAKRIIAPETIDKISKSLRGRKQSEKTKEKRSISLKETWKSPGLRELKKTQTTLLNKLGIIGTKGKPSKKKGLPFDGDRKKLSNSLRKAYSNPIVREQMAIRGGSKPFKVFVLKSIKKANRYRKKTILEKGDVVYVGINISDACRVLNLKRTNASKCLIGKRPTVGHYIFEYI